MHLTSVTLATRLMLCAGWTLSGCVENSRHYFTETSKANIGRNDFLEEYGLDIPLPKSAHHIIAYSNTSVDSYDIRATMLLDSSRAAAEVEELKKVFGCWPSVPRERLGMLPPLGKKTGAEKGSKRWPTYEVAEQWWNQVVSSRSDVLAVAHINHVRWLWLYDDSEHRLTLWKYVADTD